MSSAPPPFDPADQPQLPPPASYEPAFPADPARQARDPEWPEPPPRRASVGAFLLSRDFVLTILLFGLAGLATLALALFVLLPLYTRHGDNVEVPKVTDLSLARAELVLEANDLEAMVIDSQYVQGKSPLSIITQEPAAGQAVKRGRSIYLVVNKQTPPSTKLPDIIDVNLQQARYLLGNWGLEVGTLTYQDGQEPDLILRARHQGRELRPGDAIQVGSRIDLVVSRTGSTTAIAIPNLVGLSLGEASSKLADLNLGVGQIRFGRSSTYPTDGVVYQQSPTGGDGATVSLGTPVDLWVTGSPAAPVESGPED